MIEMDSVVVLVGWAVLGIVLMLPLILITWMGLYDEIKRRWGK